MQSNINITSNIYVVHGNNVMTEEEFCKQIRGTAAIKKVFEMNGYPVPLVSDPNYYNKFLSVGLTVQHAEEWKEEIKCYHVPDEVPWGYIKTEKGFEYVCRCSRKNTCKDCRF